MAQFRAIVESFDNSSTAADNTRELLNTLFTLGETKATAFELELKEDLRTAGTEANPSLPIESTIGSLTEVRAYTKDSATNIVDEVSKSLKNLLTIDTSSPQGVAGPILTALTGILGTALTAFLGESTGSTNYFRRYYILQDKAGFSRIDVYSWYQEIQAKSIKERVDKITVVVAKRSPLDLARVKLSTFLNIYSGQLANPSANISHEDMKRLIAEAREIIDMYANHSNRNRLTDDRAEIPEVLHLPNQDLPILR